jgi:hypothetical protein
LDGDDSLAVGQWEQSRGPAYLSEINTEQRADSILESFRGGTSENNKLLKGLILAQNERWRHGLGMQVVRIPAMGEAA